MRLTQVVRPVGGGVVMTKSAVRQASWRDRRWAPVAVCLPAYALAVAVAAVTVVVCHDLHPVAGVLLANVAATLTVFLFATALGNASIYDPYWSVAPPIALAWWMMADGEASGRELICLALVLAWSVRLTWNCFYRWTSLRQEDFRYVDLRARTGRAFPLVNLLGIELFPTLLVFLGCLPLYAVSASQAPLGVIDALAILVTAGAIVIEAVADLQLHRFLRRRTDSNAICRDGLWSRSQHPNYFGELAFWWGLWLFGLAAGTAWVWTGVGALAMTTLFVFISVPMMLARKRKRHADYDARTAGIPVLLPRIR